MRIAVFGLGYVGCVSAACFARAGHDVTGVDINDDKVDAINQGKSPLLEPGMPELIDSMVRQKRLRATKHAAEAIARSELAIVCVGTPSGFNGQLDLGAIENACLEIGHALQGRTKPYTVVVRSTMLPGTMEMHVMRWLHAAAGHAFRQPIRVAANPEFMREGTALYDFSRPPFTLVGCEDAEALAQLRELYDDVDAPFIHTEIRTAEMVKYASNAFHALKICFANEIGGICERFDTDAGDVMRIFRMDRKLNVSDAYLKPGFAFGGSCLPKDLGALLHAAQHADLDLPLLASILPSNRRQIQSAIDTILATGKRRIGIVGLAFKAGTDDLRESPMVTLAETLIGKGCRVRILDRNVAVSRLTGANRRFIEQELPHIGELLCSDMDDLLSHADVLIIGSTAGEATHIADMAGPGRTVIDLTRSLQAGRMKEEGDETCRPYANEQSGTDSAQPLRSSS